MESIRILQKITGQERKVIASVVATALDSTAVYAGAPRFAYSVEGWCINKSGEFLSPHFSTMPYELMLKTLDHIELGMNSKVGTIFLTGMRIKVRISRIDLPKSKSNDLSALPSGEI